MRLARLQLSVSKADVEALRARATREERSMAAVARDLLAAALHPQRKDRRKRLARKIDEIARLIGERGKELGGGESVDELYDEEP